MIKSMVIDTTNYMKQEIFLKGKSYRNSLSVLFFDFGFIFSFCRRVSITRVVVPSICFSYPFFLKHNFFVCPFLPPKKKPQRKLPINFSWVRCLTFGNYSGHSWVTILTPLAISLPSVIGRFSEPQRVGEGVPPPKKEMGISKGNEGVFGKINYVPGRAIIKELPWESLEDSTKIDFQQYQFDIKWFAQVSKKNMFCFSNEQI